MRNLKKFENKLLNEEIASLQKDLKKKHAYHSEHTAKYLGKDFAFIKQPGLEEESCEYCFAELKAIYTQMFQHICLCLKGAIQGMLGKSEYNALKEKKDSLAHEHKECNDRKENLVNEQSRIVLEKARSLFSSKSLYVVVIAVCEVIGVTSAFLYYMRDKPIVAIALGILSSLTLILITNSAVVAFRDSTSRLARWCIAFIVFPLIVAGYAVFGILRFMQAVHHDTNNQGVFNTPVLFVVLNVLVMVTMGFIAYYYTPGFKEIAQRIKWYEFARQIRAEQKNMARIQKKMDAIGEHMQLVGRYRIEKYQAQKTFHDTIQNMYKESVNVFIRENVRVRKEFPPCFKLPIQPLDLNIEHEEFLNNK